MNIKELVLCYKALSDETRLNIIEMLKSGKLCACKILEKFNITQPTLSYHMKILVDSGLVLSQKKGTWNYYSLDSDKLKKTSDFLNM